jgi:hypothetical protein
MGYVFSAFMPITTPRQRKEQRNERIEEGGEDVALRDGAGGDAFAIRAAVG